MPNTVLVKEILERIETTICTIKKRFKAVDSVDYFLDTPQGEERLDGLCMLFMAIGEGLKNIDKLTEKNYSCNMTI